MNDIAKVVGVSRTTVSRVIAGKTNHSKETRDRILRVVQEMNYSPDLLARAVKTKKTGNIGVIIYNEHKQGALNPFYGPILEAIIEEAKMNGFGLFILSDQDIKTPTAKTLIERRVDGVILISTIGDSVVESFREHDIPVVIVNHVTNMPDIPYIIFDEFNGVYQCIRNLIQNGHKRILYIGGPLTSRCYIRRYEAFISALTDAGLTPDPKLLLSGQSVYGAGYDNMKTFIDSKGELPTVIFAANDMMAIGAMKALYEAGFTVPNDLELIGFDDIELAKLMIPSLSTVHVPKEEMGKKAVKVIKEMIDGVEILENEIVFPTNLVIRESCRQYQNSAKKEGD